VCRPRRARRSATSPPCRPARSATISARPARRWRPWRAASTTAPSCPPPPPPAPPPPPPPPGPLDDRARLAALLDLLAVALRRQGLGATRATLTRTYAGRRRDREETLAVPLGQPTTDVAHVRRLLLAAWPAEGDDPDADDAAPPPALVALAVALTVPRPLAGRRPSFFDLPTGRHARLAAGIAEAGRRAMDGLGYLRPRDPAHPLPERRYELRPAAHATQLEALESSQDA